MRSKDLQNALHDQQLFDKLSGKQLAFFLDYDGTLTPIVSRPEDAVMTGSMHSVISELASLCRVAIISGRDKRDVQNLVDLEDLIYAGSHGFDISGPEGMQMQNEEAEHLLPVIDLAEEDLEKELASIEGSQVERKKFSIAVHYRNVAEALVPKINRMFDDVHNHYPKLRKDHGKKVLELQPDIDWDKGKAVLWLLTRLELDRNGIVPIYIGDDLTDENAFAALRDKGISILVGDHGRETKAQYSLRDTEEVKTFLTQIVEMEKGKNQ